MKPYTHTPAVPKPFIASDDESAPCTLCGGIWFKFKVGYGYVVKFCRKDGVGIVIKQSQAQKYLDAEKPPALGT